MNIETKDPEKGDMIDGRYRLVETLGEGAAGAVWVAKQVAVDRTVAVKFLREPHRDRFAARFATEARAIAQLNHPNCVTLFDYGYSVSHATFFIVLEYVEGKQLADAVRDPSLTQRERVAIVRDVARALRHAHQLGILHRDLKPENVCLTTGEMGETSVKVLDFGLARILDDRTIDDDRGIDDLSPDERPRRTPQRITAHGEAYGTPAFMSPEQALGAMNVGPKADVYSLGVLAAELLQGHLPLKGNSIRELLQAHVDSPPELDETLPLELRQLLFSMLAKDSDDRPTADEVVDRLAKYLGDTSDPQIVIKNERSSTGTLMSIAGATRRSSMLSSIIESSPRTKAKALAAGIAATVMAAAILTIGSYEGNAVAESSASTVPELEIRPVSVARLEAPDQERTMEPSSSEKLDEVDPNEAPEANAPSPVDDFSEEADVPLETRKSEPEIARDRDRTVTRRPTPRVEANPAPEEEKPVLEKKEPARPRFQEINLKL